MSSVNVKVHIAIYPGSFDPITNGHLDVLERASHLFGHVVLAVAGDAGSKRHTFSADERVAMIRETCAGIEGVEVDSFEGLVVEYARKRGAVAIVKGLRAISDFEREVQMAMINRRLAPELHTVFLVANAEYTFLSSSLVKEVAALGGDISDLVPGVVHDRLLARCNGTGIGDG